MQQLELREYIDAAGHSHFRTWLYSLDNSIRERVFVYLQRLQLGNTAQLKAVGDGVLELRMAFGAGYRVYLGRDGATLVLLLTGGSKRRQSQDIALAVHLWAQYLQSRGNDANT